MRGLRVFLYLLCLHDEDDAKALGIALWLKQPLYIGITADELTDSEFRPERHIRRGYGLGTTVRWTVEDRWPGLVESGWWQEHVGFRLIPYRRDDLKRLKRIERRLIQRLQPPLNREWSENPYANTLRTPKKELRQRRRDRE
jgi:hypothetical protein